MKSQESGNKRKIHSFSPQKAPFWRLVLPVMGSVAVLLILWIVLLPVAHAGSISTPVLAGPLPVIGASTQVSSSAVLSTPTPTDTPPGSASSPVSSDVEELCRQYVTPIGGPVDGMIGGVLTGTLGEWYDYYCVDDVVVPAGETLVIKGSTRLLFPPGKGMEVAGQLIAEGGGLLDLEIIFQSLDEAGWKGLRFLPSAQGSICHRCFVLGVESGGVAVDIAAPITFQHSEVRFSPQATAISTTVPLTLSNVVLHQVGTGIVLAGQAGQTHHLSHLTVVGCRQGVVNQGQELLLDNSILTECEDVAVATTLSGTTHLNYSLFHANGQDFRTAPGATLTEGPGLLNRPPGFAEYPEKPHFQLRPDSPAVDAADPQADYSREPGFSGNRADMGAFGNTGYAPENPQLDQVHFIVEPENSLLTGRPGTDVTYVLTFTNYSPVTDSYYLYGKTSQNRQFSWEGIGYYYQSDDYTGDVDHVGPQAQYAQELVAHIPAYATNNTYNILSLRATGSYTGSHSLQLVTRVAYPTAIKQVAHLGLSATDLVVRDGYVYVAAGEFGLRILDVASPARPKEVGFYDLPDPLLAVVHDVEIAGHYAYLAAGLAGVRIVDITGPGNPQEVGSHLPGGYTSGVKVVGDYAYVQWSSCHTYVPICEAAVRVLDISRPTAPVEIAVYPLGVEDLNGLSVAGDEIYLHTDGYYNKKNLYLLNIKIPAVPVDLGQYALADYTSSRWGQTHDIKAANGQLYAAQGRHLVVLSMAGPTPLVETGVYTAPDEITAIHPAGNHAYLLAKNNLYLLDISDPTKPVEVGRYDEVSNITGITVDGTYAYIAVSTAGIRVLDMSNPAAPVEVGTYGTPANAKNVVVVNDLAYVADGTTGLRIINVADPANPKEVGHYDKRGGISQVAVKDNVAYVCSRDLYILDVSQPAVPVEIGVYLWPEGAGEGCRMQLTNNYLYLTSREGLSDLLVLDLTDPAAPVKINSPYNSKIHDFELANGYLYTLPPSGFAWATGPGFTSHSHLDILDPVSLTVFSSYYLPERYPVQDLAVIGNLAYLSWTVPDFGHQSIDDWVAIDSADPVQSTWAEPAYQPVNYPINVLQVATDGQYAYVVDGRAGLRVLDIADPSQPTEVDSFGGAVPAQDVVIANGHIYLANGTGGLYILRYEP